VSLLLTNQMSDCELSTLWVMVISVFLIHQMPN
jgi:hypothetical protein